jgi:SH3-like domain-containing protein
MKRLVLLLCVASCGMACAQDFVSVGDQPAILFDAPSLKAKKLFVLSPHYPLQSVVTLEHWVKVRDQNRKLSWVEKSSLGQNRYVMVSAPLADVRQAASDDSPMVFQAKAGVLLELSGPEQPLQPQAQSQPQAAPSGWLSVKHQDGQSGFVKESQVWGG